MKIFLAHPKANFDDARIKQWSEAVTAAFKREDIDVTVVSGRDDFEQNATSEGGFKGWPKAVASRRDQATGERVYAGFIATSNTVGSATRVFIEDALRAGTAVWFGVFHEDELDSSGNVVPSFVTLTQAARIVCDNDRDWQNGWRLVPK